MPEGVTSSNILQPFNIPTGITGTGPPIQKAPNLGLTFPVFTPPAASSYGTTNPMAVPWTPPDLAGALNKGIETGAHLATDAIANKKSLSQIAAEEQAQKAAFARINAPGAAQYTSAEVGPGGATIRTLSPAELALQQSQIAQRNAEIAAERARVEQTYGRTPEAQAEVRLKEAQARVEESRGASRFDDRTGLGAGAQNTNPKTSSPETSPGFDWTGGT